MLCRCTLRATVIAVAALAAVPLSAAEITDQEKQLYEAAKANGESITWYNGFYRSETGEEVARAFMEKFPGVQVNQSRATSQVTFQRLSQDMRAGVNNADILTSTDLGHYVHLKEAGALMQYVPENADKVIDAFKGLDPDGYYHAIGGGTMLITYNTNEVSEEEAPKNWPDLLDPKWKDRVGLSHPGFSGYVGTWVVMMRKLYGWEYFEEIEKNNPQIGRSSVDTVTMLNSGERHVAAGPGTSTRSSAARGNPVAVVYPTDGTLLMIVPGAILAETANPNASKLFMEFLLGVENATIQAQDYGESIRPEVPPLPGSRSLADVKTIRPTLEEITEGIPEVKELWRDLFGI